MTSIAQYVPAGALMVGAAFTMLVGKPQATPLVRPLKETVPAQFLGHAATDAVIGDDEVHASGVTDYINRGYDIGGVAPVTLYIGYHATQQGDKRMHSPTLCLPGSGWTPVASNIVPVSVEGKSVGVNRYVLQKSNQRILVYYWFQGRGRITTGQAALKMNAMKDALLAHRDEEALVRIVVPVGDRTWQDPIGTTGLVPDSVATQLASLSIPAMNRSLPPAP